MKNYNLELPRCKHNHIRNLCKECQREWHDRCMTYVGNHYDMFREFYLLLEEGSHFADPLTLKSNNGEAMINTDAGVLEIRIKK